MLAEQPRLQLPDKWLLKPHLQQKETPVESNSRQSTTSSSVLQNNTIIHSQEIMKEKQRQSNAINISNHPVHQYNHTVNIQSHGHYSHIPSQKCRHLLPESQNINLPDTRKFVRTPTIQRDTTAMDKWRLEFIF